MGLPSKFLNESQKAAAIMKGRERHLCLLGNEGLHIVDRWQTMRAFLREKHSPESKGL